MIRAVLTYDDFDDDLGEYFDKSYQYINGIVSGLDCEIHSLDGSACSEADINALLPTISHQPYVFCAFCHGSDDATCLVGSDDFVSSRNSHLFNNTLFYSSACHIGRGLAHLLLQNGCQSFVGYSEISHAPYNEDLDDLFIECELYALREFLVNGKTITEAYQEMLVFMDETIAKLWDSEEYFDAGYLQDNRDRILCIPENSILTNMAFAI